MAKMNKDKCYKTDMPAAMEVSDVVKEGKDQKSLFFRGNLEAKPGQFVMAWIPGVDEKPMALSYQSRKEFAFTYLTIGKFTKACDKLKRGDKVGIRGPYGNHFSNKANSVVVGGGVGMASVSTLIDQLKNPTVINGARSKEYLIYEKRYRNKNQVITTDDGSRGRKGFTTEMLKEVLETRNPPRVYTCGPEVMMKKIFEMCEEYKVNCEASLERYMACGFGICGKCMVNDQIICVDGPVFDSKQLRRMKEFGNFARLKSGRKVTIREYHETHT